MNAFARAIAAPLLALLAWAAAAAAPPDVAVIVTFADRVDPAAYAATDRRARDGRLVQALKDKAAATQGPLTRFLREQGREPLPLWAINGLAVTLPPALVERVRAFPGVASVRPDALAIAPATLEGSAAAPEWNLDAVNAGELWSLGFTGAGVVVASMDTGVDAQHPDLAGRWRGGANSWYDPHGEHAQPHDGNGHGTQVMGLLVGGDAGGTAIGMAPGARWIAVKLFDDTGFSTYSRMHLGFQWLLDPDGDPATPDAPDVVNGSWGLVGTAGQCITEFDTDIALLRAAGIAVAFAAGNDGPLPATSLSPANNPASLAVGAVDAAGAVASFSARGPSACGGGTYPQLAAPGRDVRTADLSFGGMPLYATVSGTSFAAPHAAGALALLMQAHPAASVAQLEASLLQSAVDIAPAGPDNDYGSGLLDAVAALRLLGGGAGSPPSIDSTPPTAATEGAAYTYAASATDPAGSTLAWSLDAAPAGMTVDAASGRVSWTPVRDQVGTQAVTLRVTNAAGLWDSQAFAIEVARAPVAPVARDDAARAPVRGGGAYAPVAIAVLANDTDDNGNLAPATVAIASAPSRGGTVTVNAGGTVSYTPKRNFKGTETFRYRVGDTTGLQSNEATVTVSVP